MMRPLICCLLLACAPLFAGQSLEITGDTGTYTSPASSPWTDLGARRIEIRAKIVDPFSCSTSSTIWNYGGLAFRCNSTEFHSFWAPQSQAANLAFSGRTDVLLRLQFMPGDDMVTIEMWDAAACANYAVDTQTGITANSNNASGTNNIGGGRTIDLGWVRQYDEVLPLGSACPGNPSSNNGNMGDWEFEGALTDSSAYSMTASITGIGYVTTPELDPVAIAAQADQPTWQTINVQRAGEAVEWDGTDSVSGADTDASLTYLWTDETAGGGLAITGATTSTPTVACAAFGEYTLRLTVEDADENTNAVDVTLGCVPTDDQYRITYADPDVEFIVGPALLWGKSPWPYIDEMHVAYADNYGAKALAQTAPHYVDDWNDTLTGTVSVSGTTVTGTGTDFQNDFCSGGSTSDGSEIVIYDGNGQKWDYGVSSCGSATSITINATYAQGTPSGSYARWESNGYWVNGSDNNNYYDNVLALYALHYRTGLTIYRTYARALAVLWDSMPRINSGFGSSTAGGALDPRRFAFIGLALWAHESGQPDAWWDNWDAQMALWEASIDTTSDFTDVREDGYAFAYVAAMARLHYDSAERTASAAVLTSALGSTKRFITADWKINDAWSNAAFGAVCGGTSITVTNGSTTVTGVGTTWASCQGGEDCQEGLWLGLGDDGSLSRRAIQNTMKIGPGNTNTEITLVNPWPGPTQTSNTSTTACRMAAAVGAGTTPFMMAMPMAGMDWTNTILGGNATAVDELLDAFEWLETYGYQASTRGLYYLRSFPNCEPDPEDTTNGGTGCASATQNARYFSLEVIRALSRAYIVAVAEEDPRAADILALGDELAGASFDGGHGGPETDGVWPLEIDADSTGQKPKTFGFMFGFGGGYTWPAARLAAEEETPAVATIEGALTITGSMSF